MYKTELKTKNSAIHIKGNMGEKGSKTYTVILLCPCEMLDRRMNVRLPVRS